MACFVNTACSFKCSILASKRQILASRRNFHHTNNTSWKSLTASTGWSSSDTIRAGDLATLFQDRSRYENHVCRILAVESGPVMKWSIVMRSFKGWYDLEGTFVAFLSQFLSMASSGSKSFVFLQGRACISGHGSYCRTWWSFSTLLLFDNCRVMLGQSRCKVLIEHCLSDESLSPEHGHKNSTSTSSRSMFGYSLWLWPSFLSKTNVQTRAKHPWP